MIPRLRRAVSYPNAVATLALFVALGGSAYALQRDSVGSKQIKNSSIKSSDVKNGGLKGKDVKDGALDGSEIADGAMTGAQVLDGSLGGADLADDSVTGADVDEATLSGVTPAGPAGGELTGAYPNPSIAAGAVGAAELASLPHARLVGSGQTVQDGTVTDVALGESSLSGMSFDNGADTLTVTIPGVYAIAGYLMWTSNATGRRVVQVHVNGSNVAGAEDNRDAVSSGRTGQSVTTLRRLSVGDEITLHAQQTSGAPLDLGPVGASDPELDVFWVSPSG